jgi:hypothetical protein
VAVFLHEAALAQCSQVAAHCRKREACRFRQLARAAGFLAEEIYNTPAVRVRQGQQRSVETFVAHSLSA